MADSGPDRASATSATPVWLKVVGIAVLIVVVLFVVVMMVGGVQHGPGLHQVPPASP